MRSLSRVVLLSVALALPTPAFAAFIDFSTLSPTGNATSLGNLFVHDGIFVAGVYLDATSFWNLNTDVIARNVTDDNGLGVCSPGENVDINTNRCAYGAGGGGDYNELSQLVNQEGIVLAKPAAWTWTGIWLSSLDGNGDDDGLGDENGILRWGNNFDPSNPNFLTDGGSAPFTFPAFGPGVVEGALNLNLIVGFDASATYLFFQPGGTVGQNNDYLVWGVDVDRPPQGDDPPVPEPTSLLLLGSGLVGLVRARRRSRR